MRPFNPAYILKVLPGLIAYLPVTLLVVGGTVLLGSLLGFALARARLGRSRILQRLAAGYVLGLRCTPPIVLLFIVFYGLPALLQTLMGIDINSWYKGIFVIITLTLLYAANMSEVMRTAYEAIGSGQTEAAVSIGLSPLQAFRRIVLPQATVVALPNVCNSLINLMKDGSLAYTVGLIDMMGRGTLIIGWNHGAYALEVYLALALIYWSMTILFERSFAAVEQHLSRVLRHAGRLSGQPIGGVTHGIEH